MAGSIFGTILTMTTWGESHGPAVGVTVDSCPAGIALCEEDIQAYLDRRKPGQSRYSTKRNESDRVEILSGIFEGRTTGTPISMMVRNQDQRSRDYGEIASCYRPGHADYTFDAKYGFRDYRGGGRSSGRETIGRTAAGAVAAKILGELGISVKAYTRQIGPVSISPERFCLEDREKNRLYMPDQEAAREAEQFLEEKMAQKNSAGGIVECVISGVPAGVGEPVFEKLSANLAKAVCSIGAVKGFEIGDGFAAAASTGAENNDAFRMLREKEIWAEEIREEGPQEEEILDREILREESQKAAERRKACPEEMRGGKRIVKATNHAGGILGGISDGSDIVFRAAFKPTPSIASPQQTVNRDGEEIEISIKGRHDPIIVPRAVVVVEAMAAFTVADMMLCGMGARMDRVKEFYAR